MDQREGQPIESINIASSVSVDGTDTLGANSAASAGLLGQPDRRRAAEKLRDKGWSYRRIAENLGVPYILVSKWLSEEPIPVPAAPAVPQPEQPGPVAARPRRRPTSAEMEEAADTIETLKLQYTALESYVRPMLDALERAKGDKDAEKLALDTERRQLHDRIGALEATVARQGTAIQQLTQQSHSLAAQLAAGLTVAAAAGGVVAVAAGTAALPTVEDDPFADTAADTDPFADTPTAASADPFADSAADPFADSVADPFADSAADPFADSAADPFAASAADPFADATADPFADSTADPFADSAADPSDSAADPFADVAVVAAAAPPADAADPFADADADPFADAVPAASADPFADAEADPFADATADALSDPFADPALPAAAPAPRTGTAPEAEEELQAEPRRKGVGRLLFWKK